MFYDCGGKVKILARVVMILSIIGAFLAFLLPLLNEDTTGLWWAGLLGAIGLVISGYITSLVLYTIGDTWEIAQNTEFYLERPLKSSEKSNPTVQPKKTTVSSVTPCANSNTSTPKDGWSCSCGHINNTVRTTCSRCGKAKE